MDPYKEALHEKLGCTWPACWPRDAQNHFALYLAEKELRDSAEASEEQLKEQLAAASAREQALREALEGDDHYLFDSLKLALDWMDEHLRDDAFECDCNGTMDYEVNAFEHGDNCSAFMDQHIEITRRNLEAYTAKRSAALADTAPRPATAATTGHPGTAWPVGDAG